MGIVLGIDLGIVGIGIDPSARRVLSAARRVLPPARGPPSSQRPLFSPASSLQPGVLSSARKCRNVSGLAWSVMPTKERCPKLCWRRFSGRGTTDHFSACNIVTAILGRRAKSEFNFPHESKDAIRRNIRYQRRDTPKHFARCDSLRAIFLALAA